MFKVLKMKEIKELKEKLNEIDKQIFIYKYNFEALERKKEQLIYEFCRFNNINKKDLVYDFGDYISPNKKSDLMAESLKSSARGFVTRKINAGEFQLEKCEKCGTKENLIAHHKQYTYPFTLDDIQVLCTSCHGKKGVHDDLKIILKEKQLKGGSDRKIYKPKL